MVYKNGRDEFRPDITLLINGLPLIFVEVKKPNNKDGILAEHKRIQKRFSNPRFRNFVNITQFMIFSNNMEYDDNSMFPIEGAFYATSSYEKINFNYFREEEKFSSQLYLTIPPNEELELLKDNNLISIKDNPEFIRNKDIDTTTGF